MANPNEKTHWIRTRRVMLIVLAVWALFSFVVHLSVGVLNKITIPVLKFPLGFYMAAQGSLIVFVILLFWFAKAQDRIDRDHGFADD